VTIAVLAIIAGIAALLFVRRRRRKRAMKTLQHQTVNDQSMEPEYACSPSTVATTRISELDSRAARPWSMRTELEGTNSSPRSIGAAFEDTRENDKGGDEHDVAKANPQGTGLLAELQG
jgi:Tfp pilus assembly protein PilE